MIASGRGPESTARTLHGGTPPGWLRPFGLTTHPEALVSGCGSFSSHPDSVGFLQLWIPQKSSPYALRYSAETPASQQASPRRCHCSSNFLGSNRVESNPAGPCQIGLDTCATL